jgi:hypothetical protein
LKPIRSVDDCAWKIMANPTPSADVCEIIQNDIATLRSPALRA